MTTIKLIVTGASARAEVTGLLTSGMVGIPVEIAYDSAWDGLTKALVCRGGSVIRTILDVDGTATVPHECMIANATLQIGVEGRNDDGTLVIPTIWARCGLICSGANAEADPSTDPTLPVWAQIQAMIGNLDELETEAKNNLVAAINEALALGGGEVDPEAVQQVVDAYLAENPPAPGADGKDGVDGITPTIGENGNWYLGDTDTGKPSRGEPGQRGETGATGDTGPKGEKGDKGDTGPQGPQGEKGDTGTQGEHGAQGPAGADGKSAYQYAVDGGYTGTEEEFSAKLAQEMPEALPNPNALTFTGAVTGSYDGSAPLEVAIPIGGGGTGGGNDVFELIGEATSSGVSDVVGLTIPFDGSLYKTIIAYAYNLPAGNQKRIIIRNMKVWYDGSPLGWNSVIDTYMASMTGMKNTWGFFGAAIDVGGKLFTIGAAEANTNSGHGYFRFYPQTGALPTLSLSDCKFISLDCNSKSEILPDGCSLIVWGVRK